MNSLFWIPGRFLAPEDKICFGLFKPFAAIAQIDNIDNYARGNSSYH